jgi:hypothetical protein
VALGHLQLLFQPCCSNPHQAVHVGQLRHLLLQGRNLLLLLLLVLLQLC